MRKRVSKLEPYKTLIDEKLELGCTAMAIYKYISKKGYEDKYTILREYCKDKKEKEVEYKAEQIFKRAIKLASFPKIKHLIEFDFTFQLSINKQEVLTLKSMYYLEKSINIYFLGNNGVGKTHQAISLGVEACKQNIKTRLYTFKELM